MIGKRTFACSITSRHEIGGVGRLVVGSWRHFFDPPGGGESGRGVASRGVMAVFPPSDKTESGDKEGRVELLLMRSSNAGGTAGTRIGLWSSRGVRSGRLLRAVVKTLLTHSNSSHP